MMRKKMHDLDEPRMATAAKATHSLINHEHVKWGVAVGA
jgi:hypothetical protein